MEVKKHNLSDVMMNCNDTTSQVPFQAKSMPVTRKDGHNPEGERDIPIQPHDAGEARQENIVGER